MTNKEKTALPSIPPREGPVQSTTEQADASRDHPVRETWRPIDTAPKDGTDFLALCEYQRKHHQMVGCFAPNGKFASWPGRHNYHPTYWQPLPLSLSPSPTSVMPDEGKQK